MITSSLFHRYARALADVTMTKGEEVPVRRDLDTYREIFRRVPALLQALDSPAIQREAKDRVLAEVVARYPVSATMRNFLGTLQDHHRIRYFAEICDAYMTTIDERKGIIAARVTAAAPLGDSEMFALRESLSRATGKQVTLSVASDPNLLAGVVVQIGSTVYDGSIRTQLREMRRRLAQS